MAPPLSTLSPSSMAPFLSSKPQPLFAKSIISSSSSVQCHSSITEQLRPLSISLLKEKQAQNDDDSLGRNFNSKAIWVNPTKPKPSIISLERHQRPISDSTQSSSIDPSLLQTFISIPNSNKSLFFSTLSESFHPIPSHEDVMFLMNSFFRHPEKCLFLLIWLEESPFPLEQTIYYNLVLKSLRNVGNWERVDGIARKMLEKGPKPDNVTYSTVISTAYNSRKFIKAIEWFETMYSTGVIPDDVSFSCVLRVYAILGKKEDALALYERGRATGWIPDQVVFSILGKLFGDAGDLDGILYVRDEMRQFDITPNVVVYNTLINAAGRAKRANLAKELFDEMSQSGVTPDARTLTTVLKIYGKHKRTRDAMDVLARLKENKWPTDRYLYNTILAICTDLETDSEGEKMFEEMKKSRKNPPDAWSYSAMVKLYCKRGKVEKAWHLLFEEMPQRGLELNATHYTSLVDCLGKAGRFKDLYAVFHHAMSKGVKLDDWFYGCLLSTMVLCKEERDKETILNCFEKANPKLYKLIITLKDKRVGSEEIKELFRQLLRGSSVQVRIPYCNCLIDICTNGSGFPSGQGRNLFQMGVEYGLYPSWESKRVNEWSVNLRGLSVGAAKAALEEWFENVGEAVEESEILPERFRVFAGFGVGGNKSVLGGCVEEFLLDCGAPFRKSEESLGGFVADKDDLLEWLENR